MSTAIQVYKNKVYFNLSPLKSNLIFKFKDARIANGVVAASLAGSSQNPTYKPKLC